jgi:hypothetical protein
MPLIWDQLEDKFMVGREAIQAREEQIQMIRKRDGRSAISVEDLCRGTSH